MRKVSRLLVLASIASLSMLALRAQEAVHLGRHRIELPANVQTRLRGVSASDLGASTGGQHNVLIQTTGMLSTSEREALRAQGLELDDYLGSQAYWARLRSGVEPRRAFRGTKLRSVVPVAADWKLSDLLAPGRVPEWSRVGHDRVMVYVHYAPNVDSSGVHASLQRMGAQNVTVYGAYGLAACAVQESLVRLLAELPWVRMVSPVGAPRQLLNATGRSLSRGNYLSLSPFFGGRGLNGEGMRVGIWDGNVVYSPDFGSRVVRQEFQLSGGGGDEHGTHVAGTVLGSGMLNPQHRGLAPKAQGWTWNFSTQPGERPESLEMEQSHRRDGITVTQNSYGLPLNAMCILYDRFSYNALNEDVLLDQSTYRNPTLLHVFAAGNEQEGCADSVVQHYGKRGYGTSANRTKNVLHVGAVDLLGRMTQFSSWGPMDDGRLVPLVVAKGFQVESVRPFDGYKTLSGTSMACPTVSGHLLLVGQRYRQLHQGKNMRADLQRALAANTAIDLGTRGPDFQHGYGLLDAERMVLALERGWYHEGATVGHAETFVHTIDVPKGATQARVMIVWDDPSAVKQYSWGDKALVNDLDLTVEGELPWVCDPSKDHVSDPARRLADHLNNVEQVTFTSAELAGKSKLSVSVKGGNVPQGPQQFALVWWFDVPGFMRFTAPAGGECFEPGEILVAHVEDMAAGGFTVDISYDGGQTFVKELNRSSESYTVFRPQIPRDAPLTSRAVLRVRDAKGNVAKTNEFCVAPVVSNLKLDRGDDPCGAKQWKLTWDAPLYGVAERGYKLLLGDVPTESWEQIGDVDKAATSLDITSIVKDKVSNRPAALYSIAAVLPDGTLGRRAQAVQDFGFGTQKLAPADLPFAETFKVWPSPLWVVFKGANRNYDINPYSDVEVPNGSNLILTGVEAMNPVQEFDTLVGDFDDKNKDFFIEFRMCHLDLSAFPKGTKLILRMRGAVISADPKKPKTSLLRVLWDGAPIKDLQSVEVHEARTTDFELMYSLETDNGVHSLGIQHSGYVAKRTAEDRIILTGIYIEEEAQHANPDISLSITKTPVDGSDLGVERFELTLINSSLREEKVVDVKASLNGKWVASQRLENLLPTEERRFWFPVDLSTADPDGTLFDVEFEAICEDDVYPKDNKVSATVANLGRVIRMPKSFYLPRSLDPRQLPQDPNLRCMIGKGKRIFTDDGGLLRPHSDDQRSTLTLVPEDPSMRVRVVFKRFRTKAERGILDVYTNLQVHESIADYLPIDQLDGVIEAEEDLQDLEFISGADDGSIRFFFNSVAGERDVDEGWVAEVDLVPMSNPLSLLDVKIQLQGEEPTADIPVSITYRNNTQKLVNRALLRVADGDRLPVSQPMRDVVLGTTTDVLPNKVKGVPLRTAKKLLVELLSPDGDMSDNALRTWMVYDRYCIPQWVPGVDRAINYLQDTIHLFTQSTSRTVALRFIEHDNEVSAKVWIDWDGDGSYTEDEVVKDGVANIYDGFGSLLFDVDASGREARECRMRAIYSLNPEEVKSPCPTNLSRDAYVRDYVVVVHAGDHPTAGDIALTYLGVTESDKQQGFVSTKFGAEEPVWVEITNVSYGRWSGEVEATLRVDGAEVAKQNLVVPASEPLAEWSGRKAFKLDRKVDLSAHGAHTLEVEIRELDGRGTKENNTQKVTLHTLRPPSDGEWALRSQRHLDPSVPNRPNGVFDVVDMESAATALYNAIPRDGHGAMTVEAWIYPEGAQYGEFFSAEGLRIAVTNQMRIKQVRDNGLIVLIGNKKVAYTSNPNSDLILPNRWHHVAVVVEDMQSAGFLVDGACKVQIYVDGKSVETMVEAEDSPRLRGLISLMFNFEGRMDQLRLWSRSLTEDEVDKFMYMNVTKDGTNEQKQGLVSEYGFNEGPRSAGTLSQQGHMALLNTLKERIENEVWVRPFGRLIIGGQFSGQVAQAEKDGKLQLTFAHGVDLQHVKGASFEVEWPKVEITYNGNPVTGEAEFDFSGGKEVKVKAKLNSYDGVKEQEIVFVGFNELSDACDLLTLSLTKSLNPALDADVSVSVKPSMDIVVNGAVIPYPQLVKLTFTLSSDAKLFADMPEGRIEVVSGVTELDLSQERILTVVAANERTRQMYSLRLAQAQRLTWTEPQEAYQYGDEAVDLVLQSPTLALNPAVSSSADGNVASVNSGKLHFGSVGTTKISVHQPAAYGFGASANLEKELTVKPKEVSLRLAVSELMGGDQVEWSFAYDGLANENDAALLPDPMAHGDFVVEREGVEVNYPYQELGFRELGEYTLKAKGTPYTVGNYTVKPVDSKFNVVRGDCYRFVVSVQAEGVALAGAHVVVAGEEYASDAEGKVVCWLVQDSTYTYRVWKKGYSNYAGEVSIAREDKGVEVTLKPSSVSYTYTASTGGKVYGLLQQHLAEGQQSDPVLAQPDMGYRFTGWDDGSQANPRTDVAGSSPAAITAQFDLMKYNITYVAGANGSLEGKAEQLVPFGSDASKVTAQPAEGYYFVAWSDGLTTPERRDQNVYGDARLEAIFRQALPLPYVCTFDSGAFESTWASTSVGEHVIPWEVTRYPRPNSGDRLDGYYAMVDADKSVRGNFESTLYTPRFELPEGGVAQGLRLSFDMYYRDSDLEKSTLLLEYDYGEGWSEVPGGKLEAFAFRTTVIRTIEPSALSGRKYVQFRIRYKATWSYWVLIDNVSVFEPQSELLTIVYLAEPSDAGTFAKLDGSALARQQLMQGMVSEPVVAMPKEGHKFAKWGDGLRSALRPSEPFVRDANVVAHFVPSTQLGVHYRSTVAGAVTFFIDGKPVTEQWFTQGDSTKRVDIAIADGYKFVQWLDNHSTDRFRRPELLDADAERVVVVAPRSMMELEPSILAWRVEPAEGGTMQLLFQGLPLTEKTKLDVGDMVDIQCIANEGYIFRELLHEEEGSVVPTPMRRAQFEMPRKATLVAKFVKKENLEEEDDQKTAVEDAVLRSLSVRPNPTTGLFYLNEALRGDRIALINSQGQKLWERVVADDSIWSADLAGMPAGVYLLRIAREGKSYSLRLVKQ